MLTLGTHTEENVRRLVVTAAFLVPAAPLEAPECRADPQTSFSQQSATVALSVVQSSIDAIGGTAALRRINTIIVPVHGQMGTMEDLRQALSRRAAAPRLSITRGAP